MKRLLSAIAFACCTLAIAAQGSIRVNYQGKNPTISDFVSAFLAPNADDEEDGTYDESMNAVRQAWQRYCQSRPQSEGVTFTVDKKNGYVVYEYRQDGTWLTKIEICYWNEADGKHKLFAYNVACYKNGVYSPGQYDGLTFCRYNNASKTMSYTSEPSVLAVYDACESDTMASFDLPRTGKDITVTYWKDERKKQQKTLKWQGAHFSLQ